MADYTLTPDQVALLADGRAFVEDHEHGLAVVLGSDRLILPVCDVAQAVTALANLDSLLGAALSAAALYRRTRPWKRGGGTPVTVAFTSFPGLHRPLL